MAQESLVAIIKAKQAQIAKLYTELEEAKAILAMVGNTTTESSVARRNRSRRRSLKTLEQSPTAHEAAKILRSAGRPLHATVIAKAMKRKGVNVSVGTLVGTLSRWMRSRSVFYRARPNVFGLVTRQRSRRN
jgi:HB1, ASXL, restriction endonuclease HTH domain